MPESLEIADMLKTIDAYPNMQKPSLYGLSENAEIMLNKKIYTDII